MITAEQILDEAGQLIAEPERWHQGNFNNEVGTAWCALGAIRESCLRNRMPGRMSRSVNLLQEVAAQAYPEFVDDFYGAGYFAVADWNDAENRIHAEVVEMFEKARALAAEKGI